MRPPTCAREMPRTAIGPVGNDAYMALALMTVWAIRTGRPLPTSPVHELSAEELEDFWADHLMSDDSQSPPTPAE